VGPAVADVADLHLGGVRADLRPAPDPAPVDLLGDLLDPLVQHQVDAHTGGQRDGDQQDAQQGQGKITKVNNLFSYLKHKIGLFCN